MRRSVIAALSIVMTICVGIGSVLAANSLEARSIGVSVGLGNSTFGSTNDSIIDITGKYLITNDLALLGGLGLETHSGDADSSYIGLSVGVRKYLNTDDFALFVDGKLSYIKQDVDGDTETIDLSAGFGAEYFLYKQFSVDASIGVGFGIEDNNVTNKDDIYIGTRTIGVNANFYFK
jgi:hypothetical protein